MSDAAVLQGHQNAVWAAWQAARTRPHAPYLLIDTVWDQCRNETQVADDAAARAAVAIKFSQIFTAFAGLNVDECSILRAEGNDAVYRGITRDTKRAVLAKHRAIATWQDECDERMAQLQARIDRDREAAAERHRQEAPAMLLARIREAGGDLFLGKKGELLASPGVSMDFVGYGLAVYRERKGDFVALLQAEEAAAARATAPVVIAA